MAPRGHFGAQAREFSKARLGSRLRVQAGKMASRAPQTRSCRRLSDDVCSALWVHVRCGLVRDTCSVVRRNPLALA